MTSAVLHPPVLIVPGLGGSGPDHWQSIWQREVPNAERVEQADWDRPVPSDWLRVLAHATAERPGAVVVAHRDRKSTRLNSSHSQQSRMPSSA